MVRLRPRVGGLADWPKQENRFVQEPWPSESISSRSQSTPWSYCPFLRRSWLIYALIWYLTAFQWIQAPIRASRYHLRAPFDRWHGGSGHEEWRGIRLGLQELRWGCSVRLYCPRFVLYAGQLFDQPEFPIVSEDFERICRQGTFRFWSLLVPPDFYIWEQQAGFR